ncbi:tRNA lysidine(34) synthetase TilS [Candidatus Pelagibacter sp.]|jgi:tRNA(Ile)-lysidine synthase|nr:tRNA lysidine(34) synthetase TilS [Candidatus Pelagibacter sp.]
MSPKNLNVSKKTHKFLLNKLKDKRILQIYKKFESNLVVNKDFVVAVSGGSDSLALSFLAKIFSIKKLLNVKYFTVDHKLRKESTSEARYVQKLLKNYSINLNILTWNGVKPKKNIQSVARDKRYELIINRAKKYKIKNVLLGHHLDDLFENFFIRILRGSGLNGLISLDKEIQKNEINLIRPLINVDKKDLIYISKNIFGSYIKDPSNEDDKYKRVKVRNFLTQLSSEGLDRNKFFLTIKNLKIANENIKFYIKKNLEENVTILKKKEYAILKESFFIQSNEVVFRSFVEIIQIIGKKYYPVRGKKIDKIIKLINLKSSFKVTLGGCIIKKVNGTIILSKE